MLNYRLPISHPDYLYPPAQNPYAEKLKEFPTLVYSDHDTESKRGQWVAHSKKELHVEIGCNGGHVILEWAAQKPNQEFIGIDWKFKPIYRGASKASQRKLSNLRFLRAHAERLPFIFGPQEVDYLYLFFPDPWPKKSHWKNRYINENRLREIASIMKPGGIFHIKTDHKGYFEWMLEAIATGTQDWEIMEMSRNLHQNHPAPELLKIPDVTLFEALFIKDNIPIQSIKLKKK